MSAGTQSLALVFFSLLAACSHSDSGSILLPSFGNISDAPAPIQTAAQAVVRVHTAGAYATGSFISPNGILLTNNHVLGVEVCPQEGCYAQITLMHQLHAPPQDPQTVFLVPLAVDTGLTWPHCRHTPRRARGRSTHPTISRFYRMTQARFGGCTSSSSGTRKGD